MKTHRIAFSSSQNINDTKGTAAKTRHPKQKSYKIPPGSALKRRKATQNPDFNSFKYMYIFHVIT